MDVWLADKPQAHGGDGQVGVYLAELVQRRTLPEFQALLHDLEMIALEAEAAIDPALLEQYLERMLAHEKAMWRMAWEYAQE